MTDFAWMSESSDTKLLVSAAAMMSTADIWLLRNAIESDCCTVMTTYGPQSLVMLPLKCADRIMLPDKVAEIENSIGYHTSINQSEAEYFHQM